MNATPTLVLYIRAGCPYCRRVLAFLAQTSIEITIKDVGRDDAALQEMRALSGSNQVPCLSIDGKPLLESLDIIARLKTLFKI